MPVQRSQNRPRPQAPRADELPRGVAAPEQAEAGHERRADGTFTSASRTAQRMGGRALKNRTVLSHQTGLDTRTALPGFRPYLREAKAYARKLCTDYAQAFGGGYCGPGPASVLSSAALQLAASRWMADQGAASGDPDLLLKASRLADASRANLLSAQELVALEAQARVARGRSSFEEAIEAAASHTEDT